jgi:ABC-2 type transport system ATP-binding protein
MTSRIVVDQVSLKFRLYHEKGADLKARLTGLFTPTKNRRPLYSDFWALNDVSLTIEHGERVGIIGHNGAGKSTLLKVISGIYTPTRGKVQVAGSICSLLEIGTGFHPELSGRENLQLYGSMYNMDKAQIARLTADVIDFTGLGEFMDTPVKYYSTGMYGRLAFAAATAVKPEILIIDEMFAGGDADFIGKATQRMHDFISAASIIVFVSHQLDLIERFCRRVVWMDHGKIRADGQTNTLIAGYMAATRIERECEISTKQDDEEKIGAELVHAEIRSINGERLAVVHAGTSVVISISFVAKTNAQRPIVGFMIKNQEGIPVMGDNSYKTFKGRAPQVYAGECIKATFQVAMPLLAAGHYTLSAALVDGTHNEHVRLAWVERALELIIGGELAGQGMLGVATENVTLTIDRPA